MCKHHADRQRIKTTAFTTNAYGSNKTQNLTDYFDSIGRSRNSRWNKDPVRKTLRRLP